MVVRTQSDSVKSWDVESQPKEIQADKLAPAFGGKERPAWQRLSKWGWGWGWAGAVSGSWLIAWLPGIFGCVDCSVLNPMMPFFSDSLGSSLRVLLAHQNSVGEGWQRAVSGH